MTPWLDDGDVRLIHGDALEVLREIPDESVDCAVTSPPYWGLRDYQTPGQMGLESTPDLFVAGMVELFREVRRVLAPHGTCWVNLGDSYASGAGEVGRNDAATKAPGLDATQRQRSERRISVNHGLKPKDLVGIPWRVAFALQQDGWYLRSDIIWAKPNPMPESVTDRPTKAHEYVFLLTKQPRYWFDTEAVRERYEDGWKGRLDGGTGSNGRIGGPGGFAAKWPDGRRKTSVVGQDGSEQHRDGERWPNPTGRNVRSVWQIATQPYPEAHFATFPEELARRCILAGCPIRVCGVCGKPSERIVDTTYEKSPVHGAGSVVGRHYETGANNFDGAGMPRLNKVTATTGWSDCGHNNWRPGTVLDPFIGSGTVAKVARDHQRHAIGIDLNQTYLELAARRLQQLSLLTG